MGTTVAAPRASLGWPQLLALPEDDRRELINGHLVEVEVPTELHEWVVAVLVAALHQWAREHGGRVLASGYKIRINDTCGVMPDVQFYRKGRPPGPPAGLEQGAPDLTVEVVSVSSARYDRVTKLGYYQQIGVPEYWIVDPQERTLERLVLDDGGYRIVGSMAQSSSAQTSSAPSERFEPASFQGLSIDLAELFTLPT